MFFVLSGYVLSKPYASSTENKSPRKIFLPTFYLRRFTRIWLPWFFVFIASIFAKFFFFSHPLTNPAVSDWLNQFWRFPLTVGDFLRQCLFLLHDSSRQLLNQDWSLGVELKGSLLIPFFLLLIQRKRLFWIYALAAIFLLCLHTGHYYVSFIIGVLLARYGAQITARLSKFEFNHKLLLLVLGLLLYQGLNVVVRFWGEWWPLYKCGWAITSLGCAMVLLSAFASERIQKFLNHKFVVFLGKISYSVYLVQFIVILCLLPVIIHWANGCGIVQRPILFPLALLISISATFLGATGTYYLIEVPSIRLGYWLTKKIQDRFQHQEFSVKAKLSAKNN